MQNHFFLVSCGLRDIFKFFTLPTTPIVKTDSNASRAIKNPTSGLYCPSAYPAKTIVLATPSHVY